jgi:hypothetical protein
MITTQTPLTNEQIQAKAPSAFAGQPYEKQSDRYAFVPTAVVIDGMRQAGFLPVEAYQSRTRVPSKQFFTRHMIKFQTDTPIVALGDSLIELSLLNSHDGTSCYELALGCKRLVCLNGLMVSSNLSEPVRVRHTGNIMDAVAAGTQQLLADAPKMAASIKQWSEILLTPQEQIALAEAAHSIRFDEGSNAALAIRPDMLLASRRYADNGSDLWSVFNRIQENVIKGRIRGRVAGRRVRSCSVEGINENVKLNRALWTLADKMAELKSE